MYKYYNAHPKGLICDDCTKRAITVVLGCDYEYASRELNKYKKVTGADKFYSGKNPHKYVENVLLAKKITFDTKPIAGELCIKYPRGRFILDMRGHWSSMVDGIIYDTWDTSNEIVNFMYEITGGDYKPPSLKKQFFRYACTSEKISKNQSKICIYDGLGAHVERIIDLPLVSGYVKCLEDNGYKYIAL